MRDNLWLCRPSGYGQFPAALQSWTFVSPSDIPGVRFPDGKIRDREKVDRNMNARIPLDRRKIRRFCQQWKIAELAFFGSVLREDFQPDSDVDVLVTFSPDAEWGLFDHVAMEEELSTILDRKVDLVSRRAIERSSNWIRRKAILETAESYYAARGLESGEYRYSPSYYRARTLRA